MAKKLAVSLKPGHAMQVTRVLIGKKRLVYVILADIALKYRCAALKLLTWAPLRRALTVLLRVLPLNQMLFFRFVVYVSLLCVSCPASHARPSRHGKNLSGRFCLFFSASTAHCQNAIRRESTLNNRMYSSTLTVIVS